VKFRVNVEDLLEANMMSARETAAEGAAEFFGAWSARLIVTHPQPRINGEEPLVQPSPRDCK
jgi:hypothetical protein